MEEVFYTKKKEEAELTEEPTMDQVVYHFREVMKQRKELACQKRITTVLCIFSMLLFILSATISVATMNSYERMSQMESSLNAISKIVEQAATESDSDIHPKEEAVIKEEEVEKKKIEQEPTLEELDKAVVNIVEEQQIRSYIVKKGDTLAKISRMFYNTDDKVEEICQKNHIDNRDIILCGQELILP